MVYEAIARHSAVSSSPTQLYTASISLAEAGSKVANSDLFEGTVMQGPSSSGLYGRRDESCNRLETVHYSRAPQILIHGTLHRCDRMQKRGISGIGVFSLMEAFAEGQIILHQSMWESLRKPPLDPE